MIEDVVRFLGRTDAWSGPDGVPQRLAEHLQLSLLALAVAVVVGLPLGLLVGHTGRGTSLVVGLANALRALPSIGLLVLFVVLLTPRLAGSGDAAYLVPTELVLVLLAVPPVLASTFAGVQNVDRAARDAAAGIGMTGRQVLLRVELPCALPLVLSGVRSAALQVVATATIAAYVSLGGLGRYVFDGLAQRDYAQMASGALLVAVLAVALDLVLALLQRLLVSPGLSGRTSSTRDAVRSPVQQEQT